MASHYAAWGGFLTLISQLIANNPYLLLTAVTVTTTWVLACMCLSLFQPAWYQRLRSNHVKKMFLVGAMIGLGAKFLTIPSCAAAAWMTPPEDDVAGLHPSMNVYQQVCWGSRGTVTILEALHFLRHTELLAHHILVILGMSIIGIFNAPHRGFDLSLGALVSEIPNSGLTILKGLDLLEEYPELARGFPLWSAGLDIVFRLPATFISMAMIPPSGMRGAPALILFVGFLFYLTYVLNIIWRKLKRVGIWKAEDGGGFNFQINEQTVLSSKSFYTGLITLCIQILTMALYSIANTQPPAALMTTPELIEITWYSLPAALTGLAVSCSMEQTPGPLRMGQRWGTSFRALVGALAAIACLWLMLSTTSNDVIYLGSLMECILVSLFVNTSAAHVIPKVWARLPGPWLLGACVVGSWIVIIGFSTVKGVTPAQQNEGMSVAELLARQPAFCGLIQTWHFWCASAIATVSFMGLSQKWEWRTGLDVGDKENRLAGKA